MNKYNVVIAANDGRKFYQNFHVIASSENDAKGYLLDNLPDPSLKGAEVTQIEQMEAAEMMLPGIVYESGKAYFE